jgi:3-phosphoshikimate 1-carboxyvinyltransferase
MSHILHHEKYFMHLLVQKTSALNGKTLVPSSKSQTIRGLIFALQAKGRSVLYNTLASSDANDALHVCQQLGAKVTRSDNQLLIESAGLPLSADNTTIYTGNSGITTRFIAPLLGYRSYPEQPILLDCGEQMRARPIAPMVEALKNLGLTVDYIEQMGKCPLQISGTLLGGDTEIDGLSSQYLSALLIALPAAEKDSEIVVYDLHERPYVEMTLQWLKDQQIYYRHERGVDKDTFQIKGRQRYLPFEKTIPGDFSSASCLIVAAVIASGEVELLGLDMQDPQGDKRLIAILQQMGADITIATDRLFIRGGKPLTGLKIDANDIPDLLPALAVLGTQASGKTEIFNVKQARIKETDRIHSMTEGLKRMGAQVEEQEEGMTIYQSKLRGANIRGFDDHRTVMSFAVAGLFAEGDTLIDDAQAIQKTFPTFVAMMNSLGANMELQREMA